MASRAANKRVPISCENCRRRKIACSGREVPCHTCVRRGQASTCRFLKDSISQATDSSTSGNDQHSLHERISVLEQLLQDNIKSTKEVLSQRSDGGSHSSTSPSINSIPKETQYNVSGRLHHTSTGHVRYVACDGIFHALAQDDNDIAANPFSWPGIDFPFTTSINVGRSQLLSILPPRAHCDELVGIFLDVFSPLFHVLHDPSLEAEYRTFCQNPTDVHLSTLALIFVILAIAVTALDEEHMLVAQLGWEPRASKNVRNIAARYRNAAMQALAADRFLWQHNLHTLQALILLIYAQSHAYGPSWSLLGTTLNIAIAIGCHVDPSRFNVTVVEAEQRRRCWAALNMLHTIQNTCMGHVSPISIDSNVQAPADLDDATISELQSITDIMHHPRPVVPSKMAYMLFKFKLYQLASDICYLSASHDWQLATALAQDARLYREENAQQERFGHLDNLPVYHQAHHYILSNYTKHLYVILHRPLLNLSPSDILQADETSRRFLLNRLRQASMAIIDNFEIFASLPNFRPYKWYTFGLGAFHAFFAVVTLGHMAAKGLLGSNTALIGAALHRCLERFEHASERSEVCEKVTNFLRQRITQPPTANPQSQPEFLLPQTSDNSGRGNDFVTQMQQPSDAVRRTGAGEVNAVLSSWTAPDSQDYLQPNSTDFSGQNAIDLGAWSMNERLQDRMLNLSSQQWLSPSNFPWSVT